MKKTVSILCILLSLSASAVAAGVKYKILFVDTNRIFNQYRNEVDENGWVYNAESLSPFKEYKKLQDRSIQMQIDFRKKYNAFQEELNKVNSDLSINYTERTKKTEAINACIELLQEIYQSQNQSVHAAMSKLEQENLSKVIRHIAKTLKPQAILRCVDELYVDHQCDVTDMAIDLLNKESQGLIFLE